MLLQDVIVASEENLAPECMMERFHDCLSGRALCLTTDRLLVLTPSNADVGDRVFLAKGASMPLVLRAVGKKREIVWETLREGSGKQIVEEVEEYSLLDAAYVYRYMDGSEMRDLVDAGTAVVTVVLI